MGVPRAENLGTLSRSQKGSHKGDLLPFNQIFMMEGGTRQGQRGSEPLHRLRSQEIVIPSLTGRASTIPFSCWSCSVTVPPRSGWLCPTPWGPTQPRHLSQGRGVGAEQESGCLHGRVTQPCAPPLPPTPFCSCANSEWAGQSFPAREAPFSQEGASPASALCKRLHPFQS